MVLGSLQEKVDWRLFQLQQPGPLFGICTHPSLMPNLQWRRMWRDTMPQTALHNHADTRKRYIFWHFCESCYRNNMLISKWQIVINAFKALVATSTKWSLIYLISCCYCNIYNNTSTHNSHAARPEIAPSPASQPPALPSSDPVRWEYLSWPAPSLLEWLGDWTDTWRWCSLQLLHAPPLTHHPWCSPPTALLQAGSQTPR